MSVFDPLRTLAEPFILALMPEESVILKAAESRDGARRWKLVHRPDGLFSYSEETWVALGEDGGGVDGYWTHGCFGGVFDTADGAEDNALAALPWLSDLSRRG